MLCYGPAFAITLPARGDEDVSGEGERGSVPGAVRGVHALIMRTPRAQGPLLVCGCNVKFYMSTYYVGT